MSHKHLDEQTKKAIKKAMRRRSKIAAEAGLELMLTDHTIEEVKDFLRVQLALLEMV